MSRINMTDTADDIAKKIRKAKTDAGELPASMDDLADRPEARNLVNIYAALEGSDAQSVLTQYEGQQFGTFKPQLADLAVAKLGPIGAEMARLMQHTDEIDKILDQGAQRARTIAEPILKKTYEIVGMV